MAQPPAYTRLFDFEGHSTSFPTTPQPGVSMEGEFDRIKATIDVILSNLALIQRDDTGIANDSVGLDQLKAEVSFGLNAATTWLTATAYFVNDGVWQDRSLYRCIVAHTSGVFATDLAAVKWELLVDHDQWLTAGEAAQDAAEVAQAGAEAAEDNALVSESNAGTSETNAAASAAAALASETAAAASAASLNLPAFGPATAGDIMQLNAGKTALEFVAQPVPLVIASIAEVDAANTAKAVSAEALRGSDYGAVQIPVWLSAVDGDVETGNGKFYYDVPAHLDGWNIVGATARLVTAGVTGTTTIQIHNLTSAADILSTEINIATTATVSDGNEVIDTDEDDLTSGDILRFDIDDVQSGTAPIGLRVNLIVRKPAA